MSILLITLYNRISFIRSEFRGSNNEITQDDLPNQFTLNPQEEEFDIEDIEELYNEQEYQKIYADMTDLSVRIYIIKENFKDKFHSLIFDLFREKDYHNIEEEKKKIKQIEQDQSLSLEDKKNKISCHKKNIESALEKLLNQIRDTFKTKILTEIKLFYLEYHSKITYRLFEIYSENFEYFNRQNVLFLDPCANCKNLFSFSINHIFSILSEIQNEIKEQAMSQNRLHLINIEGLVHFLKSKGSLSDFENFSENPSLKEINMTEADLPSMKDFFTKFDNYTDKKEEYNNFLLNLKTPLIDRYNYKSGTEEFYLFDPRFDYNRHFLDFSNPSATFYFLLSISGKNKEENFFKFMKESNTKYLYGNHFYKLIGSYCPHTVF